MDALSQTDVPDPPSDIPQTSPETSKTPPPPPPPHPPPPPPQTLPSRFELPTRGSLAPQAVGGLVVAAVIKYLDAILKNFATALSQERKKEAEDPREGEDGTRRHDTGIF